MRDRRVLRLRVAGIGAARRIGLELVNQQGAPVMPSNVARPTKWRLAGVWTTRTEWPALMSRRTSSTAL